MEERNIRMQGKQNGRILFVPTFFTNLSYALGQNFMAKIF
jgi:hypothetical protein